MALSCIANEDLKEQQRRNSEIEKQLQKEKTEARRKIQLLMFGTEGSGKSSVVKNMRNLYGRGYTEEDKRGLIKYVQQQVLVGIWNILQEVEKYNLTFSNPENVENSKYVVNAYSELLTSTEVYHRVPGIESLWPAIETLWADAAVQEGLEHSHVDHEREKYFLNNVNRIQEPNYLPTLQDIVRLEIVDTSKVGHGVTYSVSEYPLVMDGMPVRLIHIKGQRPEWRKWIHCFDDVDFILFLVSLSHYDQPIPYSEEADLFYDDKTLFEAVINLSYFKDTPVILLFTKLDLFEDKIQKSNLSKHFPEFKGPENDSFAARQFICQMFLELNHFPNRKVYSHYVCSTDEEAVKVVFEQVKNQH